MVVWLVLWFEITTLSKSQVFTPSSLYIETEPTLSGRRRLDCCRKAPPSPSSNQRKFCSESAAHHLILDQPGAKGGQADSEQHSEPSSNTSTYDLRDTVSRQLGQQIPFYKYLNSGAVPKLVGSIGDSLVRDRKQDDQTERVLGSEENSVTNSLSASPNQQLAFVPILTPDLVLIPPSPSDQDLSSSFGVIRLPEGPPSRSPIPPGWSYSDPSSDNSDLSKTFLIPDSISPLQTPSRPEIRVITRNPSVGRSQSAPTSPTCREPQPTGSSALPRRRRSPFLGIAALESFSRQSSGLSLDWDNYASSPTFYRRSAPIPIETNWEYI